MNIQPIRPRHSLPDRNRVMMVLTRTMRDQVSDDHRKIATYPPQVLTKTGYRRTGTLKRSWSSSVTVGLNIEGIVGSNANIAPYNKEVQGPEDEQWDMFFHAGWMNVVELAEQARRTLGIRLQNALNELATPLV